jgi:hypothetical protein
MINGIMLIVIGCLFREIFEVYLLHFVEISNVVGYNLDKLVKNIIHSPVNPKACVPT